MTPICKNVRLNPNSQNQPPFMHMGLKTVRKFQIPLLIYPNEYR